MNANSETMKKIWAEAEVFAQKLGITKQLYMNYLYRFVKDNDLGDALYENSEDTEIYQTAHDTLIGSNEWQRMMQSQEYKEFYEEERVKFAPVMPEPEPNTIKRTTIINDSRKLEDDPKEVKGIEAKLKTALWFIKAMGGAKRAKKIFDAACKAIELAEDA